MGESVPCPQRALVRLQQLAREERAAVAAGDSDALCRIAALLQPAMDALAGSRLPDPVGLRQALTEVREAQVEAEAFLTARMAVVAADLQRISGGRRAAAAYARGKQRAPRLGTLSG